MIYILQFNRAALIITFILLLFSQSVLTQVPQSFKYQAILRDNAGQIMANQPINLRVSIRETVDTGTIVY